MGEEAVATPGPALLRDFFDRPVLAVAPDLLGRIVVACIGGDEVSVRLTEVEAYDGEADPGSHAFRGRTRRNAVMFGPPGHVYVYFTYGMHWCMNVVCGPVGRASAVLLRAGEVVGGLDVARRRRAFSRADRDLARGPARLTVALGVDGRLDGADLQAGGGPAGAGQAPAGADVAGALSLRVGRTPARGLVRTGPRVGVAGEGALAPWRFWTDGEPTVSVYRAAVPRRGRSAG